MIRTCDPLVPNQILYQTELSPELRNCSFPANPRQYINSIEKNIWQYGFFCGSIIGWKTGIFCNRGLT